MARLGESLRFDIMIASEVSSLRYHGMIASEDSESSFMTQHYSVCHNLLLTQRLCHRGGHGGHGHGAADTCQ